MELAHRDPSPAIEVATRGRTRAAYARDLTDWLAFCARHGVEPLAAHRAHVDAYARELAEVQRRARSTVARRLSALTGFYGYALDEGLIDRSPLAGVRRPKVADDSQTTGLERNQLRAVLAVARQRAATGAGQSARDLPLVTLLAYNGLRIGEALAADVEDLGTSGAIAPCASSARAGDGPPLYWPLLPPGRSTTTSAGGKAGRCSSPPAGGAWMSRPPSAWCGGWPRRPGSSAPTASALTACAMPS
jgi:hypothetical protein